MTNNDFVVQARKILSDRGYERTCNPLENLAEEMSKTQRDIRRKVLAYKWPGLVLLAAIPLMSTFLSILVTGKEQPRSLSSPELVIGVSWALTFLTVLNSIFRPSERFKEACRMGVDFSHIKRDFLAELENLSKVEESHLHAITSDFDKLVAPYQKELISMFLPEMVEKTTDILRPNDHGSSVPGTTPGKVQGPA